MSGKYKNYKSELIQKLPVCENNDNGYIKKVNDENNMAYVDSFFSYLSSQLLNHHKLSRGKIKLIHSKSQLSKK